LSKHRKFSHLTSNILSLADQTPSILWAEYFTRTATFGITVSNSITEETDNDSLIGAIPLLYINIPVCSSVYRHNNFDHKMTIISFLARRHVSAMYSRHQANIGARFRCIKCALNGIPSCLQYWSVYSYTKTVVVNYGLQSTCSYLRMPYSW